MQEKLEAFRSRQSKKDRQYNGQKKKGKRTNNDQQNITRKTNDRATRIGGELRCSGMVTALLHMLHHRVTVKRHHLIWKA